MDIVYTKSFLKSITKLKVTDDELGALESDLASNPAAGDVIPGLKGIRKMRFAFGGKGKRGGGRCIYLAINVQDKLYLLLAYSKSQQTDLSVEQRQNLKLLIEDLI